MKNKIELESMFDNAQTMHLQEFINYYTPDTPNTGTVTGGEIKLWVTGSRGRSGNLTNNELLLRTDDATLHFNRESEFGKLAHAMIDRYNNHDALVNALQYLLSSYKADFKNITGADLNDTEAVIKAKQVLNNIK